MLQEERKKADIAAERSKMIKLFRTTLQERSNYSRESRLARNRAVSKTHERLARDAHKARDDDKGRRMDALKVRIVFNSPRCCCLQQQVCCKLAAQYALSRSGSITDSCISRLQPTLFSTRKTSQM